MKQFDIFDKPLIGLYTKTAQGGLVSLFILAVSVCTAIVTFCIIPAESVETSVRTRNSFLQSTIMSMDIFIQNSLCDDLEYEFLSPSASFVASAKNISMESDLQKQACRVYGNTSIEPGEGGLRIQLKRSLLTHKKEQYSARNRPLCFKIKSLTFGNTSQHTLSSSLQGYEGEGQNTVINLKVYKVRENNGDDRFEYAASISSMEDSPGGLSFYYAFQPEYIIRQVKSNSTERVVLGVISFGAFYTLLSLVCNVLYKRKDFGKRDFYVCIQTYGVRNWVN